MISFIVPMDQGLDQLTPVQLVIVVSVVHLEIMKLELLFRHAARVDGDIHVLLHVLSLTLTLDIVVKNLLVLIRLSSRLLRL